MEPEGVFDIKSAGAHAFGVRVGNKSIAHFGDMSMFSFHATKSYHSIEGGMLTFQDSGLKRTFDYLKNFGFKKDVISERVTWALNLLNLSRYRKVSPFMLSGGERKRVALATILAWDPKILVLDEPTIGQDFNEKDKLRQFIIQLNSQGRTVIMVTHDVEFVADCNPRVIVMSQSRIIADDSARDILTNYDILSKASIISPQITQLFRQLSDLDLPPNIIDLYEAKQWIVDRLKE